MGCECRPDLKARIGKERAGRVGGLGEEGILVNVGTQFNFRSQAVISGYKQHFRIPAVLFISGYVRTLKIKRGHLNYPANVCGFLLVSLYEQLMITVRLTADAIG